MHFCIRTSRRCESKTKKLFQIGKNCKKLLEVYWNLNKILVSCQQFTTYNFNNMNMKYFNDFSYQYTRDRDYFPIQKLLIMLHTNSNNSLFF